MPNFRTLFFLAVMCFAFCEASAMSESMEDSQTARCPSCKNEWTYSVSRDGHPTKCPYCKVSFGGSSQSSSSSSNSYEAQRKREAEERAAEEARARQYAEKLYKESAQKYAVESANQARADQIAGQNVASAISSNAANNTSRNGLDDLFTVKKKSKCPFCKNGWRQCKYCKDGTIFCTRTGCFKGYEICGCVARNDGFPDPNCNFCKGKGRVVCEGCKGQYKRPCTNCQGTGKVPCTYCKTIKNGIPAATNPSSPDTLVPDRAAQKVGSMVPDSTMPNSMMPGSTMPNSMMPGSLFDSTKSLLDKTLPTASKKLKNDILNDFDKKVKTAAKGDFEYQKKKAPDDPNIAKLADAREKLFDRQVEIAGEVSAKMKGKSPDEIAAEIGRRIKTDPKCLALQKEIDAQKASVRGGKAAAPSNANSTGAQSAQVQAPAQTAQKQAQASPDEDLLMKSKMHHLETWSLEIDAVKCMDKVIEADGTKFNSQKMQSVYEEYLKLSKLPYAPDFATYLRRNYPDIISDPDPQLEKANIERVFAYVEYDKKRREIEDLKAQYAKEMKANPKLAEIDKTVSEDVKKRRIALMKDVESNEDFWMYTLNDTRNLLIDTFDFSHDKRFFKDTAELEAKYKAEYAAMSPAQRGKMNYDDFIWQKRNTPDPKSTERDQVVKAIVVNKMMSEYSWEKLQESRRQMESVNKTGSILLPPSAWDAGAPYRKIQKDEMSPGTSILYEKK